MRETEISITSMLFNLFGYYFLNYECSVSKFHLFLHHTVKKPDPHTDRCNPHVDRQFRNPHVDHSDPHVDQKDPRLDHKDPRVDHSSKFSVESDLYMIHVWIIYKFLEIMLLEKRNNYILTKLMFLFFH